MCGDEPRSVTSRIDKPDRSDLQARAIWRLQTAVHRIADPVVVFAHIHNFILSHMPTEFTGHILPIFSGKAEFKEEARFAASGCVRGFQQVSADFSLRHLGFICVGDFHVGRNGSLKRYAAGQ